MTLVDTHAHIYHSNYADHHAMIERAFAAGVGKIMMPNVDIDTIEDMHRLSEKYPDQCFAMMGLHPCHVQADYQSRLDVMREWHDRRAYVGVGEIGIDLYWDKSTEAIQVDAFRQQIQWARDLGLPIVIHSREALDLTIAIVKEMQDGTLTGVFHCFNGTVDQGRLIVDTGFYMGIGGVLTYKNAGIDKSVSQLPIEHMVLETDAPYLTPVQFRKKGVDNEPAFMVSVAQRLAKVLDMEVEDVAKVTTANAEKLFPQAFIQPLSS